MTAGSWRYTGTPARRTRCPCWAALDRKFRPSALRLCAMTLSVHTTDGLALHGALPAAAKRARGGSNGHHPRTGMIWQRSTDDGLRRHRLSSSHDRFTNFTAPEDRRYTGTDCDCHRAPDGTTCDKHATAQIRCRRCSLFQRHSDGKIALTGTPCAERRCPVCSRRQSSLIPRRLQQPFIQCFSFTRREESGAITAPPCPQRCPKACPIESEDDCNAAAPTGFFN